MVICLCHRITDHQLASVVRQGCASFDELQFETGVATHCGVCEDCAREVFEAHACAGHACTSAELGAGSAPGCRVVPINVALPVAGAHRLP